MQVAGISDIGLVRSQNQDNYAVIYNRNEDVLAMVCDGIGGANSGDVASLIAVREMSARFSETSSFQNLETAQAWFEKELKDINDLIFLKTTTIKEFKGMGTTFVGFYKSKQGQFMINVGDSRGYLIVNEDIKQVTVDHSLVSELVAKGEISLEDSFHHPQRNILTNALGVVGSLRVDFFLIDSFDYFVLCTDGLSSYVKDDEILSIVTDINMTTDQKLNKLIDAANNAGGFDNTTVIIGDNND